MPGFLSVTALTVVPPGAALHGKVAPPGSKSITNRVLLLAALARGSSYLTGALKSDDTARMAEALRAMGVVVDEPDATSFLVTGDGSLRAPAAPLLLGNAGTATRFLTAAAALADGPVVIDGDAHMRKRPIAPLVEALEALGVMATAPTGCPPVTVDGQARSGGFQGGRVEVDAGLSSQYVSALLMLGACGRRRSQVVLRGQEIGARGYVDLTLSAMRHFGAEVVQDGPGSWSLAPTGYAPTDLAIEPDASAATYLWAAAALTGGAIDIGLEAAAFSQPDARAHALIRSFPSMPAVIDGAQMQDAIPTLAVMAAFNRTPVRFTGIANLRVKECDRVRALALGLSAIRPGLGREDGDDLLVASDPFLAAQHRPARIETFADHRIAMGFALAGLLVEGITILDPGCVAKTYPGFWDALAGLGVTLRPDA
jgi:3-phosphoshikimate 1-carboxyvinyltransferase